MVFGRKRQQTKGEKPAAGGFETANWVLFCGVVACFLFLFTAGSASGDLPYSEAESQRAVAVFWEDHASLCDLLSVDACFPKDAVAVGAFFPKGEEAYLIQKEEQGGWRFKDYLWDAFRTLVGAS